MEMLAIYITFRGWCLKAVVSEAAMAKACALGASLNESLLTLLALAVEDFLGSSPRCQSAIATGANVQLSGCIWASWTDR